MKKQTNKQFDTALSDTEIYQIAGEISKKYTGSALDLGAGQGNFTQILFKQKFTNIKALDLYPNHFRFKKVKCDKINLNNCISLKEKFNLIVALSVIEHLENPWKFAKDIKKHLKTRGGVIIAFPNITSITSKLSFLFRGYFPFFTKEHRPKHLVPLSIKDVIYIFETANLTLNNVLFTKGRIPKTKLLWQQIFPFLEGELFADQVIIEFKKNITKG